ncbi:uncharacterized protein GGS25DRAFT_507704 [Hypoxylon fragiforme]|uniref:uncharacterized protein n=1 Tax=Hypoxylon fragiforme TaxID=63214 RepID=UPI0020C6BE4A|nr:uncharacterized protein GGS25DRAFT_507704 [Hypoxylon fragiforme]KAI2604312.1 hypothetical protein GGS25DRAFT_507704 [Hypoxylon fragiforme]
MPETVGHRFGKVGAKVCFVILYGIYKVVKFTYNTTSDTVDAGYKACNLYRVNTRRLPKSKPIATESPGSNMNATTGRATSFLHLPPEIRLYIYYLTLKRNAVTQVNSCYPLWGSRPVSWAVGQGIRSDDDEPSESLRIIIGLGGSALKQLVAPPRRGCVSYGCISRLICGERSHFVPGWVESEKVVFYTDLMRTCRVVYGEVLDILYSENTISLFGAEMARYFCRNASPEGLRRVRFVHLALIMPSTGWDSSSQQKTIRGAMRILQESLLGLQQLDVEVVLTWGQPKDPRRFWDWLKDEVFGQLRGLQTFVLKVSVYKPFAPPEVGGYAAWMPQCEPLDSWRDGQYRALKDRATSSDEAVM